LLSKREKDQIESNQHKIFSLHAAFLRWVKSSLIDGEKIYSADQLANLKNNMLIELKYYFGGEKSFSLSLLKGMSG